MSLHVKPFSEQVKELNKDKTILMDFFRTTMSYRFIDTTPNDQEPVPSLVLLREDNGINHLIASDRESSQLIQVYLNDIGSFIGWKLFDSTLEASMFLTKLKKINPECDTG